MIVDDGETTSFQLIYEKIFLILIFFVPEKNESFKK